MSVIDIMKSPDDVGEDRSRPSEHQHARHRLEVSEADPAFGKNDGAGAHGRVGVERVVHRMRYVLDQVTQVIEGGPDGDAAKMRYEQDGDHADDDCGARGPVRSVHDGSPKAPEEAMHHLNAGAVKNDGQAHRQQGGNDLLAVLEIQSEKACSAMFMASTDVLSPMNSGIDALRAQRSLARKIKDPGATITAPHDSLPKFFALLDNLRRNCFGSPDVRDLCREFVGS